MELFIVDWGSGLTSGTKATFARQTDA